MLRNLAQSIFLGMVMGSACIYASYPHVLPVVEKIAKEGVKQSLAPVDKILKPVYPVGTFEHEVKRTI